MHDQAIERQLRSVTVALGGLGLFVVAVSAQQWQDMLVGGRTPPDGGWMSAIALLALPAVAVAFWLVRRVGGQLRERAWVSEAHLAHVLGASSEWIWAVDTAGRIVTSNDAVERLLGWRADEVIGRPGLDFVDESQRDEVSGQFDSVYGSPGEGWTGWLLRLRHRDGSVRQVLSTASVAVDDRGRCTGMVGTCRDVTDEVARRVLERRRALDQAERRSRVERVIEDRRLEIHVQPVVTLDRSEIVGVEALSRFPGDRGPAQWFREAGLVGRGTELELLAMNEALARLPDLPDFAFLAINLSPTALLDPRCSARLASPELPHDRLVLELTEHAEITDYDGVSATLQRLRALGMRLAVDDAGAGYASLRHILNLRPDIIKLDRSIAATVDRDPAQRALAGAMVQFAREIGAVVVAEGVERGDCAVVLHDLGVPWAQGYLFGRPAPLPVALDLTEIRLP